mmetsp:Transcript_19849/g.44233  ORF Transcript_19849/g.44233 Transcript_19849/m.44233 type:complete len:720 (+) Transcript_19849:118-2277(+)
MIDDEEIGGGAAAGDGNDSDNGGDADVEVSSAPPAPDAEGSDAAAAAAGGGGGSSSRGRERRQGGAAAAAGRPSHAMTRAPSKAQTKMVHSCIVKLIVQRVDPNYAEPWRTRTQTSSSGTGFLVSGRRIITNAHVVQNCTHVRARKSLSPVMFSCTVEWLSIPLDLAVLTVNNEDAFFGVGAAAAASVVSAISEGPAPSEPAPAEDAAGSTDANADASADGTDTAVATTSADTAKSGAAPKISSDVGLPLCPILPRLDENVTCVGFPQGGQQISVTRGVVSRVDVDSHGVLRIQIDAAINPGNSGGPVFDELGRVIGIASSGMRGSSNIGYIIPTEVLSHFMGMTEDGLEASPLERSALNAEKIDAASPNEHSEQGESDDKQMQDVSDEVDDDSAKNEKKSVVGIVGPRMVPGIAGLGANTQTLESKALRKRLGLKDNGDGGGVRVSGVWAPTPLLDTDVPMEGNDTDAGSDINRLLVDDVLLSIDGVEVGQDGTIPLSEDRPYERIGKSYLITRHRVGKMVELGIIRKGEPMTLQVPLRPNRYLCPVYDTFDAHSSYVICGGCVFVPVSWPWISAHRKKGGFPSYNSISSNPAKGDEQIIVLSKVLADEVNVGYHLKQFLILRSVNGSEPSNMRDLVRLIIKGGSETNLELRCYNITQEYCEQLICLDVEEVKKAEERILKQHMVAQWCSEDAIPPEMKMEDSADVKTMVSMLDKCSL